MNRRLAAIIALIVLWSPPARGSDDLWSQRTGEPVEVASLDQANSLPPDIASVSVHYTYQMHQADVFTGVMTLAS